MWWLIGIGYLAIGALLAAGIGIPIILYGCERLSSGNTEPVRAYEMGNLWRAEFARAATIMFFWGIILLLLFAISFGNGVRRIIWRLTAPPKK